MPSFPDDLAEPGGTWTTWLPGQSPVWEGVYINGMYVSNWGRDLVMIRNDMGVTIWYSIKGVGPCSMDRPHHRGPVPISAGAQAFETQLDMRQYNDIQGRAQVHFWADAEGTIQLPDGGGGVAANVAGMVLRTSTLGGLIP